MKKFSKKEELIIVIKLPKWLINSVAVLLIFFVCVFGAVWCTKKVLRLIYPLKYTSEVEVASSSYGVEKELIYAIIKCESGFDEDAKSHAGACGLMQITPETFEWLKKQPKNSPKIVENPDLRDPMTNVMYGTLLVSVLRNKYGEDTKVLSAYNAGMTAVDRWLGGDKESLSSGDELDYIAYPETKEYVRRVLRAKKIYKKLYF